jgi:hypothetical protein
VTTANLLYDSISRNTGDIAIGIAATQVFGRRGVSSQIVSPWSEQPPSPLVIGGGELIRERGDRFYDSFRADGPHILHSAGVWTGADQLDYLNGYRFVSARSEREAEVLRRFVPDAEVVPCATTLLESPDYRIRGVDPEEPLVGIHLVPHSLRAIDDLVPVLNRIPFRKVLIPFTHYNFDASFMTELPFSKKDAIMLGALEPLELHAVMRRMKFVIVSSLHASIFAYSQNIPFVSVYQKKVDYYFRDRGLGDLVVADHDDFAAAVKRVAAEPPDFSDRIADDVRRVSEAFDRYAAIIRDSTPVDGLPPSEPERRTSELVLAQMTHVVRDRDLAIAYTEARRLEILNRLHIGDPAGLAAAEKILLRHRNRPWRVARRVLRRIMSRLRTRAQPSK